MNLMVVFSLAGIILGALVLDYGGWFVGGLVGFLLGQGAHLAKRLRILEHELDLLRKKPDEASPGFTAPGAPAVRSTEGWQKTPDGDPDSVPIPSDATEQASQETTPSRAPRREHISPPSFAKLSRDTETAAAAAAAPSPAGHSTPRPALPVNKLLARIGRFFTEGNPIVRVGMVVMFFGLSFLVRYASSEGMFPIELRLAAIAAIAIGFMVLGWFTRGHKNGYGLVLQGGGIAALYLTIFAATKVYPLLPSSFAFALMFVIVMLGAAIAVLQNAQVLALMATAGGFLAPILTSDGSGNHVGLFSFYLLLNLGVLAIAWFKTWRLLNWVGFVFTFVISSAWGVLEYEPQLYASTQPFLLGFFALYLLVSILFALKQAPKLTGLVDGSLVFGLPIVGFGLQTALLKHTEYGLAISAVLLAAIYIGLAAILWSQCRQACRLLTESFLALGVTFATLAIPLALDADWTSATWALEASGLIWVGLRQQRLLPRAAGYLLYAAAAISPFVNGGLDAGAVPIISGDFIGLFILATSALCIAWLLKSQADNVLPHEDKIEWIGIGAGVAWWLIAGSLEVLNHTPGDDHFAAIILFTSLSMLAVSWLAKQLSWQELSRSGFCLLPLVALWVAFNSFGGAFGLGDLHPLKGLGVFALAIYGLVQYRFLWEQRESRWQRLVSAWHVLSAWLILALTYWEASWWQDYHGWSGTSALVLWFACFAAPLVLLMTLSDKRIWPFEGYRSIYNNLVPAPAMLFTLLWFIEACFHPGSTTRLHLPVLNPLDLAQLATVLVIGYSIRYNVVRLGQTAPEIKYSIIGLASFIWINVVVLRAVHHVTGVDYVYTELWNSVVVQMALSILWTVSALVVMNLSRRKQERRLWLVGAGLLALVLLKLFTKDLTGSGTLARILSFMVVGGLMLTIGYLSPMPVNPKASRKASTKTREEALP